jgi:hypothetical protein
MDPLEIAGRSAVSRRLVILFHCVLIVGAQTSMLKSSCARGYPTHVIGYRILEDSMAVLHVQQDIILTELDRSSYNRRQRSHD